MGLESHKEMPKYAEVNPWSEIFHKLDKEYYSGQHFDYSTSNPEYMDDSSSTSEIYESDSENEADKKNNRPSNCQSSAFLTHSVKHVYSKHPKYDTGAMFRCPQCPFLVPESGLRYHIKLRHRRFFQLSRIVANNSLAHPLLTGEYEAMIARVSGERLRQRMRDRIAGSVDGGPSHHTDYHSYAIDPGYAAPPVAVAPVSTSRSTKLASSAKLSIPKFVVPKSVVAALRNSKPIEQRAHQAAAAKRAAAAAAMAVPDTPKTAPAAKSLFCQPSTPGQRKLRKRDRKNESPEKPTPGGGGATRRQQQQQPPPASHQRYLDGNELGGGKRSRRTVISITDSADEAEEPAAPVVVMERRPTVGRPRRRPAAAVAALPRAAAGPSPAVLPPSVSLSTSPASPRADQHFKSSLEPPRLATPSEPAVTIVVSPIPVTKDTSSPSASTSIYTSLPSAGIADNIGDEDCVSFEINKVDYDSIRPVDLDIGDISIETISSGRVNYGETSIATTAADDEDKVGMEITAEEIEVLADSMTDAAGELNSLEFALGMQRCKEFALKARDSYNPDKHCGVIFDEEQLPCLEHLDCKYHNEEEKIEVFNRTLPFKDLLKDFISNQEIMDNLIDSEMNIHLIPEEIHEDQIKILNNITNCKKFIDFNETKIKYSKQKSITGNVVPEAIFFNENNNEFSKLENNNVSNKNMELILFPSHTKRRHDFLCESRRYSLYDCAEQAKLQATPVVAEELDEATAKRMRINSHDAMEHDAIDVVGGVCNLDSVDCEIAGTQLTRNGSSYDNSKGSPGNELADDSSPVVAGNGGSGKPLSFKKTLCSDCSPSSVASSSSSTFGCQSSIDSPFGVDSDKPRRRRKHLEEHKPRNYSKQQRSSAPYSISSKHESFDMLPSPILSPPQLHPQSSSSSSAVVQSVSPTPMAMSVVPNIGEKGSCILKTTELHTIKPTILKVIKVSDKQAKNIIPITYKIVKSKSTLKGKSIQDCSNQKMAVNHQEPLSMNNINPIPSHKLIQFPTPNKGPHILYHSTDPTLCRKSSSSQRGAVKSIGKRRFLTPAAKKQGSPWTQTLTLEQLLPSTKKLSGENNLNITQQ